ncbi:MAG: hypothetical protein ACKOWX_04160 [Flavobacteriales bacterium]
MKLRSALFVSLVILTSCSSPNPKACTCGKELSKSIDQQDAALMEACSKKEAQLQEKAKVRWFEEVMNCVE